MAQIKDAFSSLVDGFICGYTIVGCSYRLARRVDAVAICIQLLDLKTELYTDILVVGTSLKAMVTIMTSNHIVYYM